MHDFARHIRSYLKSDIQPKERPLYACMYYRSAPRYTVFLDVFREFFTKMKIGSTLQMYECRRFFLRLGVVAPIPKPASNSESLCVYHLVFFFSRVDPSQPEMDRCDFFLHKGMRMKDVWPTRRRHKFPHVIFWEFPLMWREDPVEPERVWSYISWDYLQG